MLDRSPLLRLGDYGQSVWCDHISRDFLLTGGLSSLVTEDGISGLTSNPTIFRQAIADGSSYDQAIAALAGKGKNTEEILEMLMVEDIRLAADQLEPVFSRTSARDGWVSMEVVPTLAYAASETVAEVVRVRSIVKRPNLLVKVPATRQGVEAIQELVSLGYSINVTLIFSLDRYREVMEAYVAGLEKLRAKWDNGKETPSLKQVHGVASFFVSRVDTAVDGLLDEMVAEAEIEGESEPMSQMTLDGLRGRTAVANAKEAYRLFRETFSGPRWGVLQGHGANVQRPLWASTSTKNPRYSDILYVQELIGPETVNTMPLGTIAAYRDHGEPAETITIDTAAAAAHLDALSVRGVDLQEVTTRLEQEGVEAFAESYRSLLAAVEQKRHTLAG